MSLKLEDIRPIRDPNRRRGQVIRSSAPRFNWAMPRRGFIKGALATGAAASMWAIGFLPPARAGHPGTYGYRKKPFPCPDYSCYDSCCNSNCNKPCCDSDIYTNACVPYGNHKVGWHKKNSDGYSNWDLREGDCVTDTKDAWKWDVSATCGSCVGCGTSRFRCHDGWYLNAEGGPNESICSWLTACSNCG